MSRLLTPAGRVFFLSAAAVGGFEEARSHLGGQFDFCDESDYFGKASFEEAEAEMARLSLTFAIKKAGREPELLLGGDLENQCMATAAGPATGGYPFLGLFGACSTAIEALGIGAMLLSSGGPSVVAAVASSHNATAERQFRTPLEYGAQRTPTAQWTATAAGAFLLGSEPTAPAVELACFLPGCCVDAGICDAANMGAAMAPAAADTLLAYAAERDMGEIDRIVTGDLGREGSALLSRLLAGRIADFERKHLDAGSVLYTERQDVHAGGSGCGCIASYLAAELLPRLQREGGRALVLGTGALMNTTTLAEGGSIAGVCHLIEIGAASFV